MADFADLKPIITNTKKKGSGRTTRSSVSSKFSKDIKEIPEIPDTLQVKGHDKKPNQEVKPNVFTIDSDPEKFTLRHWNALLGYLFVRMFVPLIVISHCCIVMLILYVGYKSSDGYTTLQLLQILVPLVLDLLITRYVRKFVFKNSLYLIHPDYPLTQQIA